MMSRSSSSSFDAEGAGERRLKADRLRQEMEGQGAGQDTPQGEGQAPGDEEQDANAPSTPADTRHHIVQQGETLEGIAAQYSLSPEAIWDHSRNEHVRRRRGSPDALEPGDELFIPAADESHPVGQGDYVVKEGDCIASIARATGHFSETIWDHPDNTELKEVRQDPNVLLPGDRVTIPELQPKQEAGDSELRHRFVRRGEPCPLMLHLTANGEPIANEPFVVAVEDRELSGTTDVNGRLQVFVPAQATRATLRIRDAEYALKVGHLDPAGSSSGVRARLINLDYCTESDGDDADDTLREAIERFQEDEGLSVTGEPDEETRRRLQEKHEC